MTEYTGLCEEFVWDCTCGHKRVIDLRANNPLMSCDVCFNPLSNLKKMYREVKYPFNKELKLLIIKEEKECNF